jgi:alpha-glucosidase
MSPAARYFWRPPEIDDTRFPWSHGPAVEANFRKYAGLRYRLLPYYTYLAWQAYQTGLPILRPLVLEFQDDPRLADVYDQIMLGDRLMLCPVVEAGATARRILLPEGIWHDFWSEQTWEGPAEIEYPAPLDCLPMLVRGGTILPLGPELQHIPDDHRFDSLELHLWPPYPAQGWLYEDDGLTCVYQQGAYALTSFSAQAQGDRLEVRIGAAEGDFPEQADSRQVEIILHRSPAPQRVLLNGEELVGWRYEARRRETRISQICPVHQQVIVEIAE